METKNYHSSLNLMADLLQAILRNNLSPKVIRLLADEDTLKEIGPFLDGRAQLVEQKHHIDTGVTPILKDLQVIHSHNDLGLLDWNKLDVSLFEPEKPIFTKVHEVREMFDQSSHLNLVVLQYLLNHPRLIPIEWRGFRICFMGTVLKSTKGNRICVPTIVYDDKRWKQFSYNMKNPWEDHMRVILVNPQ